MQTIEIVPDLTTDQMSYRAICGEYHAIGQTAGQALDTLAAKLAQDKDYSGEIEINASKVSDRFS